MRPNPSRRRVVVGIGYPWFLDTDGIKPQGRVDFGKIELASKPGRWEKGSRIVSLDPGPLGAWQRCRLVLEPIRAERRGRGRGRGDHGRRKG